MGCVNLGSVLGSVGNVIKPLAQTAIRAVAPQVTTLLKGVVGDLFTQGKNAVSTFMKALPLPSPLKSLAEKLLGKGFDALKNYAQGAIEKFLSDLVNKLAPRTTGDGVTVTPPTLPNRTDRIVRNTPSGGTSSSSSAAAGTGGSGRASSSAGIANTANLGWSGGPPDPSKYDMTSPEGANKFQADMFKYQQAMNNIATFWQTMSNAFKAMSDTQKTIAQNIR
jgi:hypothetical protein